MDWPSPKKRDPVTGRTRKNKPGAGRPAGSTKAKMSEERRRASLTGDLPHQFLLRIMRGEVIYVQGVGVKPDLAMRVDCAKAAAPYYAPKLAQVQVLESLSDEDLDFVIKNSASEAGIDLGAYGESPPPPSPQGESEVTTGGSKLH